MSDAETVKLYADMLWWWLMLLAAGGIPLVIGSVFASAIRMRLMLTIPKSPGPAPLPPHTQKADARGMSNLVVVLLLVVAMCAGFWLAAHVDSIPESILTLGLSMPATRT